MNKPISPSSPMSGKQESPRPDPPSGGKKRSALFWILASLLCLLLIFGIVLACRLVFTSGRADESASQELSQIASESIGLPTLPGAYNPPVPTESETAAESADTGETSAQAEESTLAPPETAGETSEENTETAGETSEANTETAGETSEGTSDFADADDPTVLAYHLRNTGMTEDDLVGSQLIVVQSYNTIQCTLYFFEKDEDGWHMSDTLLPAVGTVGSDGVGEASDSVRVTPEGYWKLGPPAFGIYTAEEAGIDMEYFQIEDGDYWVGDSTSYLYNQHYNANTDAYVPWNGGEDLYELRDYYELAIFIRYNADPPVPYMGSAFFLHVALKESTGGCVATGLDVMWEIFGWIHESLNPHILIY